jgi:hypothetical protein
MLHIINLSRKDLSAILNRDGKSEASRCRFEIASSPHHVRTMSVPCPYHVQCSNIVRTNGIGAMDCRIPLAAIPDAVDCRRFLIIVPDNVEKHIIRDVE